MSFQVNPYIRYASYDTINFDWIISRAIFDYELIYIDKGSMEVLIGKKKYIAKEGTLIFLKPKENHVLIKTSDILSQPHVHFDLFEDKLSKTLPISFKKHEEFTDKEKIYIRNDNLKELSLDFLPIMTIPNIYTIKQILFQLIDEFNFHRTDSREYQKALLIQMLLEIKRGLESFRNYQDKNCIFNKEEIRRYIFENANKKITIDDLATFSHISKFYFARLFKSEFNKTPIHYVNEIKCEKAIRLLRFTNYSINEIALQLSFDSPQSFSRWFKSLTNCSPLQYKKSKNC